jgi:hypothetical protein
MLPSTVQNIEQVIDILRAFAVQCAIIVRSFQPVRRSVALPAAEFAEFIYSSR